MCAPSPPARQCGPSWRRELWASTGVSFHPPGNRSQPYHGPVRPRGATRDGDRVPVLEEAAPGPVGQPDRLGPVPRELYERAPLVGSRAGDGTRGEEVAGPPAGPVHRHV